jgi:hypothetical protein
MESVNLTGVGEIGNSLHIGQHPRVGMDVVKIPTPIRDIEQRKAAYLGCSLYFFSQLAKVPVT